MFISPNPMNENMPYQHLRISSPNDQGARPQITSQRGARGASGTPCCRGPAHGGAMQNFLGEIYMLVYMPQ